MNDMSQVIEPRSDQLNADTLLAGPMTVTIKNVIITGGQEQPVSIELEETPLFFRPCKSMSRVLVGAWGADAKAYIGRSLTLYRDPEVKWGGLAVGGIRISHMSNIDGVKQMMLTATKGSRKPHKVMPLMMRDPPAPTATGDPAEKWAGGYIAKLATFTTPAEVQEFATSKAAKLAELETARPDLHEKVVTALATRTADLAPSASGFEDDDLTADEPKSDSQIQSDETTDNNRPDTSDALIGAFKKAETIIDLRSLYAKSEMDRLSMPPEILACVEQAYEAETLRLDAKATAANDARKARADEGEFAE